ncbi:MAG: hypothetical protein AMXMBFR55_03020 [Gemmatimonadota bacterium]
MLLMRLLLLTIVSLTLGCGTPGAAPSRQLSRTVGAGLGAVCTARVVDSSLASVDGGGDVYVEPQTISPAPDGSYLLAGMPNYVGRSSPGRPKVSQVRDSVFGAIRSRSGRWTLVPLPPPVRRFGGARATAIGDGRWEVVFVQLGELPTSGDLEQARDAWYGIVTADGWEQLERIPLPDRMLADYQNPTRLMRSGDTLTWAFRITRPDEVWLRPVGVVQRVGPPRRGHWKFHFIDLEIIAVTGLLSPGGKPRVLVEHEARMSTGEIQGVRFALAPDPVAVDTVMEPTTLNRFNRQLDVTPDGTTSFTWMPERTDSVMRRISITLGPDGEVPVSRTVTGFYPRVNRIEGRRDDAAWTFVADARDRQNNGRLEFVRVTADTQVVLATLPHRYVGLATLAPRTSRLLQFTGPVLGGDSSEARIASLLTTVDFACRD